MIKKISLVFVCTLSMLTVGITLLTTKAKAAGDESIRSEDEMRRQVQQHFASRDWAALDLMGNQLVRAYENDPNQRMTRTRPALSNFRSSLAFFLHTKQSQTAVLLPALLQWRGYHLRKKYVNICYLRKVFYLAGSSVDWHDWSVAWHTAC